MCQEPMDLISFSALKDVDTMEYILNGDFVMTMFRKIILYDGITLEYSGSDTVVERINSSQPLRKDLLVEVSNELFNGT